MERKAVSVFRCIAMITFLLSSVESVAQDGWERILSLEGQWKFSIGDKATWADTYYNDKDWETIYVPAKWEDEGFNGYNGFAWYRKSFDGNKLSANDPGFNLFLGYIDDVDEVYLNGHKIGYSGSFPPRYHTAYNAKRNYMMPKEYINFTGKNVIAVRVYDAEIQGGIVSGDVGIYVNKDDRGLTINLRGVWDFKLESKRYQFSSDFDSKYLSALMANVNAEEWTDINVPNVWEHQGYRNYDGGAWYRKRIMIPKDLAGEDLVLLLGKIDDSDKTYLNGKLIGATHDKYDKLRIYYISAGQFKAGEVNTLLVFVDDPRGYGGIYSGPIGMMKQSDFTRYIRWK